ncbi:MAG: SH3 domain-containing protein [Candidatus Wallbacteria bacterium]|nr:SH3 domain-containing protein [Candidatus Wallbacteria bacterium]
MKYFLVLVILLISTCSDAGGIKSLINDFTLASENRMALQSVAQNGGAAAENLDELYLSEEHLAGVIEEILSCDDDISRVVLGYLAEEFDRSRLYLFERFLSGPDLGPEAIKLKECIDTPRVGNVINWQGLPRFTVATSGACLTNGSSFDSEFLTLIPAGTVLEVKGSCSGFFMVSFSGETGFVHSSLLSIVFEEPATTELISEKAQQATVTATSLNVRSGPGTSYSIIDCLSNGVTVPVLDSSNGWYKIITPNNITGWSSSGYLSISDNSDDNVPDNNDPLPGGDIPPDLSKFTRINNQEPTYYCSTREQGFPTSGVLYGVSYDGTEKKDILTPQGDLIKVTSGRWFACLCMQGSGIMNDNRTATWGGIKRFIVAPAGCKGITATGYWVVSFHSMAVNKNQIPYKGVYFVPKCRGLLLPNGETHDGYWFAHDTGSAFTNANNRVDLYSDMDIWVTWMENNMAPSHGSIEMWRVDDATMEKVYSKYKQFLGK